MLATGVTRKAAMALALVLVVVGAAACSSSSPKAKVPPAPKAKGAPVHFLTTTLSGAKTRYGQVIVEVFGDVAYANKNESSSQIRCKASCTKTWKPWISVSSGMRAGHGGVKQTLIGTIRRPDGSHQVTYGGHPLYFYNHAKHPLQANAQGAGGEWYVVNVTGQLVT